MVPDLTDMTPVLLDPRAWGSLWRTHIPLRPGSGGFGWPHCEEDEEGPLICHTRKIYIYITRSIYKYNCNEAYQYLGAVV